LADEESFQRILNRGLSQRLQQGGGGEEKPETGKVKSEKVKGGRLKEVRH
jgi:hypothetical protein